YHRPSTTQDLADRPDRERQRGLPVPLYPLRRSLVLSKQQINPRKIELVFDGTCPSCGFELDRVLGCRASLLPAGRRLLTSLKCRDPELLREPDAQVEYPTRRGSNLPRDLQPGITTGID